MQTSGTRVTDVLATMWHAQPGTTNHTIAKLVGALTDVQAGGLCNEGEELLVRLARAGQLVELRGQVEDRAAASASAWAKVMAVVEQLEDMDEEPEKPCSRCGEYLVNCACGGAEVAK